MNTTQKVIKVIAICLAVFIIANIFRVLLWGVSILTNISIDNKKDVHVFTENYKDLDNVIVDVSSANIVIESGEAFKVEINNMKNVFTTTNKNHTLKIKEKNNWFWHHNSNGEVIIYVPNDVKLNKLEIDNGAGTINIFNISSYELKLNQGAGKLLIDNSNFDKTNIDGGAGTINVTSSKLDNLDLDAGVGKIEIEAYLFGNSTIDCGVGEMNITLLGARDDYRVVVDKGIGSINIDNSEADSNTVYGNGSNSLKLEGGIGKISVNFKDYLYQ